MNLTCETCPVRDSAACSVLSDKERDALAQAGRTRVLKRGEMLFAAGDEDAACATLVSGALKICATDRDGNEQILALAHPSGFIGEMFAPFAHHDVVALTESRLCVFPKRDMQRAIEDYPALARALLRRSQEDLHSTRSLLELTAHGSAEARLAALLHDFARAASDSPCHPAQEFELPLSRGEIANMLGLTIETVSRKLGELEDSGAIRRKGKRGIELVDPAYLRMLSGKEED
ncbi:Crp/Fnr family transcriptional regulator [Altererythrobacter arenosus]|uniref:Crp/Fnr family transcriptional regulator n=1 Tax=Altererythrobacter arenosus TaxID=3032592 RepID=A0ABY8FRD3_9SPHN|nr:Crp/Fnr family transcriptional regulator [Altererythrobacter sp. CAU 1644]WFL77578.1 Crp/Fnr family transcriptional regulator [Altererythrobacter sp. CAU 1644]